MAAEWEQFARCNTLTGSEADALFFLNRGQSPDRTRAFCRGCLVTRNCLEAALEGNEEGIWCGTTEKERRQIARALESGVPLLPQEELPEGFGQEPIVQPLAS